MNTQRYIVNPSTTTNTQEAYEANQHKGRFCMIRTISTDLSVELVYTAELNVLVEHLLKKSDCKYTVLAEDSQEALTLRTAAAFDLAGALQTAFIEERPEDLTVLTDAQVYAVTGIEVDEPTPASDVADWTALMPLVVVRSPQVERSIPGGNVIVLDATSDRTFLVSGSAAQTFIVLDNGKALR